MKIYIVMTPPEGDPDGMRTLFLRDGFSIVALVLPFFWLLRYRLWLAALGFLAFVFTANWLMGSDGLYLTGFALSAAGSILVALEGTRLRIAKLERQGFSMEAVIEAETLGDAEELYFAGLLEQAETPPPPLVPTRQTPITPAARFGILEWNGAS